MKNKFFSKLITIGLAFTISITIAACSDSKDKESSKTSNKSTNSISMKFVSKTTTKQNVTTQEIDKSTLDNYTKILSNIFSKGSNDPKLFKTDIASSYEQTFKPDTKSEDETVDINLHLYAGESAEDNFAVAEVTQSKKVSGKKLSRTGKIYFDKDGIVIGFDLSDFAGAQTTSTSAG